MSIRIEYMNRSAAPEGGYHHDFIFHERPPRLYFLYRPGHYDILYIRDKSWLCTNLLKPFCVSTNLFYLGTIYNVEGGYIYLCLYPCNCNWCSFQLRRDCTIGCCESNSYHISQRPICFLNWPTAFTFIVIWEKLTEDLCFVKLSQVAVMLGRSWRQELVSSYSNFSLFLLFYKWVDLSLISTVD